MEGILKYLNENPGVGIIIATIAVLLTTVGWFIKKEKQKNMYKNSPHINAGGDIKSGGHIIVGSSNVIGSANPPEFHLQLYGSGAKREIEGHIEKQSGPILVAETIEIDGLETILNQQFTKLVYLKNLNFPTDLFTTKKREIIVKVVYRTLDGKKFEYSQGMSQEERADNLFNIALTGSPSIKGLS